MTLCLFEDAAVAHLAPLALTRGAFDLRVGARTLGEGVVALLQPERLAFHTRRAVAGVVADEHPGTPVNAEPVGPTLFVNARWIEANLRKFRRLAADPLFEIANHGTEHRPLSVTGRSAYGIAGTSSVAQVVDEVMVNPVASARRGTDPATAPARDTTLELLAKELF